MVSKKIHVVLFVSALLVTLLYVWVRLNIYHLSYELNDNLKIKEELLETNRKLKIETASLKSPKRIARLAVSKLGLKINSGAKTVLVEDYDTESSKR